MDTPRNCLTLMIFLSTQTTGYFQKCKFHLTACTNFCRANVQASLTLGLEVIHTCYLQSLLQHIQAVEDIKSLLWFAVCMISYSLCFFIWWSFILLTITILGNRTDSWSVTLTRVVLSLLCLFSFSISVNNLIWLFCMFSSVLLC